MKKRWFSILLAGVLSAAVLSGGCGKDPAKPTPPKPTPPTDEAVEDDRNLTPQQYSLMNLAGSDALGRPVSPASAEKTDKTRYVGLFYSVWLGQHSYQQTGIYNISELLESPEGEAALMNPEGTPKSPVDEFHFWGEPLYGYYNMKDPYVVTRHVELLTMAGIDYLCIDNTNAIVYKAATENLLTALLKFQNQGFDVPKVAFYTNSDSGTTVQKIYSEFYQTEKYASLWFSPKGKPMLVGITEQNKNASDQTKYNPDFSDYLSAELQEFFDVRESEWPNGDFNADSVPWMSWEYPQNIHSGSVAVPVAQHSHDKISVSFRDPECSRGYDNANRTVETDFRAGKSFQTMWDSVFERDSLIDNVLVTSFNEWMAIKQNLGGTVQFVDVFDEEHSRDLEMMKGGYNDNFYLQLVENVRKYKYEPGKKYAAQTLSIDIEDDASDLMWEYVRAAYKDFEGDAIARNFVNASGTARYLDNSNRNDITDIKMVSDDQNLCVMVRTASEITAYNGKDLNWMNLLLKVGNSEESFAGYQYVVNRSPNGNVTSVERSKGGYDWERVGDARIKVRGNVLYLSIPLRTLGLTADGVTVEFKVSDNVTDYDDIMDYYVTGDSAPIGRLGYRYGG